MIFPESSGAAETISTPKTTLGDSLAFDYAAKRFSIVDGSPVRITGTDAIKQWIELFVRTIPKRYAMYSDHFGVDVTQLIGKKAVPSGAVLSEIKREVEEGILLCPAIQSVYGFNLSGNNVTFTVTQIDGEESEVSIEL